MWQRQIHSFERSAAFSRRPAGWGSCTMTTSHSSSSPCAFIAL